jgi:hypothetical protein
MGRQKEFYFIIGDGLPQDTSNDAETESDKIAVSKYLQTGNWKDLPYPHFNDGGFDYGLRIGRWTNGKASFADKTKKYTEFASSNASRDVSAYNAAHPETQPPKRNAAREKATADAFQNALSNEVYTDLARDSLVDINKAASVFETVPEFGQFIKPVGKVMSILTDSLGPKDVAEGSKTIARKTIEARNQYGSGSEPFWTRKISKHRR